MREITGNIWAHYGVTNSFICMPINTDVKLNGRAVMARGMAARAKHAIPGIDLTLGRLISNNRPFTNYCVRVVTGIMTFKTQNHWFEPSTLDIIQRSAMALSAVARAAPHSHFYLPRPGCGNGGLRWEDVRRIIAPLLPDNVCVVSKAGQ